MATWLSGADLTRIAGGPRPRRFIHSRASYKQIGGYLLTQPSPQSVAVPADTAFCGGANRRSTGELVVGCDGSTCSRGDDQSGGPSRCSTTCRWLETGRGRVVTTA